MFRQWWRDRDQIMSASTSRDRLSIDRRKLVFGESEDVLMDVIYERRSSKEKVTREWIADQARRVFRGSRSEEEHEKNSIRFVADTSMKRNNLSMRRPTNLPPPRYPSEPCCVVHAIARWKVEL